jgi:formylglycine-generating enzyme required for sulfatase activity
MKAAIGKKYIDVITGKEAEVKDGMVLGKINGICVGGILEVEEITAELQALLDKICPGSLSEYVKENTDKIRGPKHIDHKVPFTNWFNGNKPDKLPEGMVWVQSGAFIRKVERPWHGARSYDFSKWKKGIQLKMKGFAIDTYPVTNKQFEKFLKKSGYKPKETRNFLKHWKNGRISEGLENHPVVWISQQDAKAYAKWAGKRLPTEIEWEYAAQGPKALLWPWGNTLDEKYVNSTGKTQPVGSIPEDKSPFGCHDMSGHVWHFVDDRYTDTIHSFTILKGGSFFRLAKGASKWYCKSGPVKSTTHLKLPLLSPSIDRFSTVGFRCVID